jgi:hypothetical protein
MAAVSVAASTAPVIRIRTLATNSISIALQLAEPAGVDAASNSGATIAGHEADLLLGGIITLGPQRSSLSDQQQPRYAISSRRRRDLPERLQALQDDLELLTWTNDDADPYPPLRAARLGHRAYHCP